jgi:hypothetical protein
MLKPFIVAACLPALPLSASVAVAQPTDTVTTLRLNAGQSSQDIRGTVVDKAYRSRIGILEPKR